MTTAWPNAEDDPRADPILLPSADVLSVIAALLMRRPSNQKNWDIALTQGIDLWRSANRKIAEVFEKETNPPCIVLSEKQLPRNFPVSFQTFLKRIVAKDLESATEHFKDFLRHIVGQCIVPPAQTPETIVLVALKDYEEKQYDRDHYEVLASFYLGWWKVEKSKRASLSARQRLKASDEDEKE